ncbi:MAG: DNA double-strand break repair nuclease NurA [Candidatus Gracilibacteria bacterium]|nr:DNA double-strand break repair nuclease NurA [Candidatus Gracilibacteria bacterium]
MLDFRQVASFIPQIMQELQDSGTQQYESLQVALETLKKSSSQSQELKNRYLRDAQKVTWLVGLPLENPDQVYALPKIKKEYQVAATDGSGFELSRHDLAPGYLINIGRVFLAYTKDSRAELDNVVSTHFAEEDLFTGEKARKTRVKSAHINLIRDQKELGELASLASSKQVDLALVDGSLIRWTLESVEDDFKKNYLKEYLKVLVSFEKAGLALASYISLSNSTEATNFLRIAICPYDPMNCDTCPDLPCNKVDGVLDRSVFAEKLKPGERSVLFESRSKILKEYGQQTIYFFYLHVGSEIARVEVPKYVADEKKLLDQVHGLLYDQAQKGQGYPVSLMEAHEQAVVTMHDKELFLTMLEQELVRQGRKVKRTEKSLSKKRRIVGLLWLRHCYIVNNVPAIRLGGPKESQKDKSLIDQKYFGIED